MKFTCLISGHNFDPCQICKRCGSTDRANHRWGPWLYLRNDSCDQARTCTVCGQTDFRSDHHESVTIEGQQDTEGWTCSRCHKSGATPEGEEARRWMAWSYNEF